MARSNRVPWTLEGVFPPCFALDIGALCCVMEYLLCLCVYVCVIFHEIHSAVTLPGKVRTIYFLFFVANYLSIANFNQL